MYLKIYKFFYFEMYQDDSLEESEMRDLRELLLQKDQEIAALKRELQAANKRMENNPGIIIEGFFTISTKFT